MPYSSRSPVSWRTEGVPSSRQRAIFDIRWLSGSVDYPNHESEEEHAREPVDDRQRILAEGSA
jgi:hypothetical protein